MAITNLPPVAKFAADRFNLVVSFEHGVKFGNAPNLAATGAVGSTEHKVTSPIGPVAGAGTNDLGIS